MAPTVTHFAGYSMTDRIAYLVLDQEPMGEMGDTGELSQSMFLNMTQIYFSLLIGISQAAGVARVECTEVLGKGGMVEKVERVVRGGFKQ